MHLPLQSRFKAFCGSIVNHIWGKYFLDYVAAGCIQESLFIHERYANRVNDDNLLNFKYGEERMQNSFKIIYKMIKRHFSCIFWDLNPPYLYFL